MESGFYSKYYIKRKSKFLRFAFGDKAYQYQVLPYGLAMDLRTSYGSSVPVVQLSLLHIRPFQWWIKSQGVSPNCHTFPQCHD